jgi:hypothetical protein
MAYMPQAKDEQEIKALSVSNVRKEYLKLAEAYNKIIDNKVLKCPACDEFISTYEGFYTDKRYVTGYYPECKKCVKAQVEQRTNSRQEPNETVESVQKMLLKMDLPYIDSLYMAQVKNVADASSEKNRHSAFAQYIVAIKSLPQYNTKTWADSEFAPDDDMNPDYEQKEVKKTIKAGRKRFGNYPNEDLMFLEDEYQDWTTRYSCESKAQELLFKRICFKELEIDKAQKSGRDTKEMDKTLQELMSSLSVKPSQKNSNSLTETMTFGQLIDKWEQEKPIPEPDEEFKDVDKIGLYIDVFFKGHLSKMMGLKNAFSALYERYIAKYTVKKPEYDEDVDSEVLFDKIFGKSIDEE